MIRDSHDLAAALEGTALGGRIVESLHVPEHDEAALAVAIAPDEVVAGWTAARRLLDMTGRWPVATASWNRRPIDPDELFSRIPYEASSSHDTAPLTVLARASKIDAAQHIAAQLGALNEHEPIEEWIDHEVSETYRKFGKAPSTEQVQHVVAKEGMRSRVDLDRWLFSWELANVDESDSLQPPHSWYQMWHQPSEQRPAIVFLPTPHSWETLAFMSWWASELAGGNEPLIAVLHDWHERFGAELVAHWGTILQFAISRRPPNPGAAWRVALEHELIAPYTLHQLPIREHARTLLHAERWLLHERP